MANAIRFGFVKKQGIKFECALCKHFPTLMNIRSCNRKKCISKSTSQDSTHLYIVALDHKKKKNSIISKVRRFRLPMVKLFYTPIPRIMLDIETPYL